MMFKPWQLRAIREACGWSQGRLAKKTGISQPTISNLEKGVSEDPSSKTINAIVEAFEEEGFYFTDNGIEKKTTNTFTIEGQNCYLELLQKISHQLAPGEEFLKSGADERRSSDNVIDQLQIMRDHGIKTRTLLKPEDTYIMGNLDEYRWMDEKLYTEGDVKIIFNNCVAYLVSWIDVPKIIVIEDKIIAKEAKKTFNYIWERSKKPTQSDAKRLFSDIGDNNG